MKADSAAARKNVAGPLPALTGARFFAALAVVFYHYGRGALLLRAPLLEPLAACGPAAVSFFYVLSGAVMTWGCTGVDGSPARTCRVFWSQRGARILPAYWLALGLSLAPAAAHVWKTHTGASGVLWFGAALVAALLLLQAWSAPLAEGLNTPGWSISCEGFFYLVWPGLVGRLRSSAPGFPACRVAAFYLLGMCLPVSSMVAIHLHLLEGGQLATLTEPVSRGDMLARVLAYLPLLRLPEFATGIALGHALRSSPPDASSPARATAVELLLLASIAALALALGNGLCGRLVGSPLANRVAIESGIFAPLFAYVVWRLARCRGLVQRAFSTSTMLQLGEASYGLYILQEPVVVWFRILSKRAAPSWLERWDSALFWSYAVLLVLVSLAVHRLWEMPLRRRLLGRLAPRAGVAQPAA